MFCYFFVFHTLCNSLEYVDLCIDSLEKALNKRCTKTKGDIIVFNYCKEDFSYSNGNL